MKIVRIIEILLGLVFLSSAMLKAIDLTSFAVQITRYGVLSDPDLIRFAAVSTTLLEAILGAMLLTGLRLRGLTYAVTLAILVGFTGLIGYAWVFHDLADCGCFGSYIKMGPGLSSLKNVVMIAMLGWTWQRCRQLRRQPEEVVSTLSFGRVVVTLACVAMVGVTTASYGFRKPTEQQPQEGTAQHDVDRPFAQFRFEGDDGTAYDLGRGEHIVVMLSATCEHCMASVGLVNQLMEQPNMPPLVGLMLGEEEERDTFVFETGPFFPLFLIDPLEFFQFIGQAPPRFHYVEDGRSLKHWDWVEGEDAPDPTTIAAAVDMLRQNR